MILEFSIVHREDILEPVIETQVWIKIVSLAPLLSELPPFQTQTKGCSCLMPRTEQEAVRHSSSGRDVPTQPPYLVAQLSLATHRSSPVSS